MKKEGTHAIFMLIIVLVALFITNEMYTGREVDWRGRQRAGTPECQVSKIQESNYCKYLTCDQSFLVLGEGRATLEDCKDKEEKKAAEEIACAVAVEDAQITGSLFCRQKFEDSCRMFQPAKIRFKKPICHGGLGDAWVTCFLGQEGSCKDPHKNNQPVTAAQ